MGGMSFQIYKISFHSNYMQVKQAKSYQLVLSIVKYLSRKILHDIFLWKLSLPKKYFYLCKLSVVHNTLWYQESPLAWTQDAYHPPHSKCSICWWGICMGDTPSSDGGGYPIEWCWGVPHPGYPPPSRAGPGVTPHHSDLAQRGTPSPSRPAWGTPPPIIQTWPGGTPGTPYHRDLAGVPPTIET